MTEVEATPPMASHVPPPSPKKRPFDHMDGLELNAQVEQPWTPSSQIRNNDGFSNGAGETSVSSRDGRSGGAMSSPVPSQQNMATSVTPDTNDPHPVESNLAADEQSTSNESHPVPTPTPTPAATMPNKRVKLTPAEKEAKERQKAEERVRKEEEKRKKEEERRRKEEEKKKRDEEREEEKRKREEKRKLKEEEKQARDEEREEERKKREEKRKLKEEEKQAREEEKKKKDEEKMKKERSQMRLNTFFSKPANPSDQPQCENTAQTTDQADDDDGAPGSKAHEKQQQSDYEQDFPPFFVQSHVRLGPPHRFERDSGGLDYAREKIDKGLQTSNTDTPAPQMGNPADIFRLRPYRRRQGRSNLPPVKEILMSMQDSSLNMMDFTTEAGKVKPTIPFEDMLKKMSMKTLKFIEDVRPPYHGTFTKRIPDQNALKLCRNPFSRAIDALNYDYDSEAEWEEPEEGEDLNSEGEDEMSEEGDDDMDDFVDDDGDQVKRKAIVGDLEPICSGIRWDDGSYTDPALKCFRMEIISDTHNFPIDPFSDIYWRKQNTTQPTNSKNPAQSAAQSTVSKQSQFLQPNPPSPLSKPPASTAGGKSDGPRSVPNGVSSTGQAPSKARAPFPQEHLSEFRDVVAGSDLTKAGLIEVLKKRFPKVSKDVIKDTLNGVAARQGQKEADKRWVLL